MQLLFTQCNCLNTNNVWTYGAIESEMEKNLGFACLKRLANFLKRQTCYLRPCYGQQVISCYLRDLVGQRPVVTLSFKSKSSKGPVIMSPLLIFLKQPITCADLCSV